VEASGRHYDPRPEWFPSCIVSEVNISWDGQNLSEFQGIDDETSVEKGSGIVREMRH
jgi:hypothetical protein